MLHPVAQPQENRLLQKGNKGPANHSEMYMEAGNLLLQHVSSYFCHPGARNKSYPK